MTFNSIELPYDPEKTGSNMRQSACPKNNYHLIVTFNNDWTAASV